MGYITQAVTGPLIAIQNHMRSVAKLEFEKIDDMLSEGRTEKSSKQTCPVFGCGDSMNLKDARGSLIREVSDIRDSFTNMANGLRSFAKYMDPYVVKLLVQSKRQARLGMAKANVTIFFSDIVGFTTLAELLP